MYAGFDVFDTLLGRKVSPPTAVFNLLGKRLNETNQIMIPPNLFANERINAERRCYQNLGHQTNLNDIYRELLESLPNIKATAQDLEKTEFLIEKEITFPIAHHKNILDRCREEGKKIVFISDTYLHTECIEILLRHHEIFLDGDRIFTSCDAGASKSTSKLFEYALKTLGIDPESIIFYGNNPVADLRGANNAGIVATLLPLANSTRFEESFENSHLNTDGYTASLAAASKFSRLANRSETESIASICSIAAGVAAPMLTSYIFWVLQKSNKAGIRRLYFLSRDGQVMLDIATRLCKKLNFDIECRYLYASRPALSRAYECNSNRDWYLADLTRHTSAFDILSRLSATDEKITSALEGKGFDIGTLYDPISISELEYISDFINSEEFKSLHKEFRSNERKLIKSYLSKNGVFESQRMGIVDIGWSGTLHELICTAAVENGSAPLAGFLFGAKKNDNRFGTHLSSFYFNHNSRTGHPNPLEGKDLFFLSEIFCCADHGTVIGFQNLHNEVVPQLEEGWAEIIKEWEFDTYRNTIINFLDFLDVQPDHNPLSARDAIGKNLRLFWKSPTRLEAEAWGKFPWDAGMGNESGATMIAERLSPISLLLEQVRGPSKVRQRIWPAGSIAVSSAWVRALVRMAIHSRGMLRKLRSKLKK